MRREPAPSDATRHDTDPLDTLSLVALRDLVRELLQTIEIGPRARLLDTIAERAARGGWRPALPAADVVDEVTTFVKAQWGRRVDPRHVDRFLRQAHEAFIGGHYATAFAVYRTLFRPLQDVYIDLGQDETIDEVLDVDVARCAAQYVIAMYMTSAPRCRAEAVREAIAEVYAFGYFLSPLRELERVAVAPLPEWPAFLADWRALLASTSATGDGHMDMRRAEWLREVTERLDGVDGLAALARTTGKADHYRAWCFALRQRSDWSAALDAYLEATDAAAPGSQEQGSFVDGACLAAQELGRDDLATYLERAWRAAPTLLRLRRWLGTAADGDELRAAARTAREVCPEGASSQQALLGIVLGDVESAASALGDVSEPAWWDAGSVGHVVFDAFCEILGGVDVPLIPDTRRSRRGGRPEVGLDEMQEVYGIRRDEPQLPAPSVTTLVARAWAEREATESARAGMLEAMRTAAERRVEKVVARTDRRAYAPAARLVLACVAVDGSEVAAAWRDEVRQRVRRYPAMCRYLDGGTATVANRSG